MVDTLADALPRQIKFMNEVAIPAYEEVAKVAPMTKLTIAIMRADTQEAVEALASGDVVRMMEAYAAIKDVKL